MKTIGGKGDAAPKGRAIGILCHHKGAAVMIIVIVILAVYLYYPRNLYGMAFGDGTDFTVIKTGESPVELSEQQKNEIRDLFRDVYMHKIIFRVNYTNEDGMGYYIMSDNNMVYILTGSIINVNGKQYVVYGSRMDEKFNSIIESEEMQ